MDRFYKSKTYLRKYFGKPRVEVEIPPLLKSYVDSYYEFLQPNVKASERINKGLEKIFRSVFPIEVKRLSRYSHMGYYEKINYRDIYLYSHYMIMSPPYSEAECITRGLSYTTTLYIVTYKISLVDDNLGDLIDNKIHRNLRFIQKNVTIYPVKDFPLITSKGTFIVNGIERSIVSQLQRSPGIYSFSNKKPSTQGLKIIPYYGIKIELEENKLKRNPPSIRFYKKRIPYWTFFEFLGITKEDLVHVYFNTFFKIKNKTKGIHSIYFNLKNLFNGYVWKEIRSFDKNQLIFSPGETITLEKLKSLYGYKIINNLYESKDAKNLKSNIKYHKKLRLNKFYLYNINIPYLGQSYIEKQRKLLVLAYRKNPKSNSLNSFVEIQQLMKKGHYPYKEEDRFAYSQKLLLDHLNYSISYSGRKQINRLFGYPTHIKYDYPVLTKLDFLSLMNYYLWRRDINGELDNLYNIQNRRVRMSGELIGHIILKSFLNVKKKRNYFGKAAFFGKPRWKTSHQLPSFMKKRISYLFDIFDNLFINKNLLKNWIENRIYALSEFDEKLYKFIVYETRQEIHRFLTGSDLSQLLDKLNPLAQLTHLRRVSLLGPDGLQKDNVSMDTRDVQFSYFGRICPIETPEGKGVGIVNSLTTLSLINKKGFISTPYILVTNGQLQNQVHYLDGEEEYPYYIALSEIVSPNRELPNNQLIYCRYKGSYLYVERGLVNYVDIVPFHILSISSALVPFIEHNDGNRALMGANMQRQAVSSVVSEVPCIGTGLEYTVGKESSIFSKQDSIVTLVDNTHVYLLEDCKDFLLHASKTNTNQSIFFSTYKNKNFIVEKNTKKMITKRVNQKILHTISSNKFFIQLPLKIYELDKYKKNSQKTYVHQTNNLKKGEYIKNKDLIADQVGIKNGEVAIGHNILVGFMSMNGYSFEDSIVISDRIHKDGLFNSIHTKEFIVFDWETHKTKEKITRNIPNINFKYTEHLDPSGVIRISNPIKWNTILVGKIQIEQRRQTILSERDKFLQSLIMGDHFNKRIIKNTSKKASKEMEGYVVDVKKYFFSTGKVPEIIFSKEKNSIISNFYLYKNKKWIIDQHLLDIISRIFTIYIFKNLEKNNVNNRYSWSESEFQEYLKGLKRQENNKSISYVNKVILAFMVYYKNRQTSNIYKNYFNKSIRSEKLWRVFNRYTRAFVKMTKLQWISLFIQLLKDKDFYSKLDAVHLLSLKKGIFHYILSIAINKRSFYINHIDHFKKLIACNAANLPVKLVKLTIAYKHQPKPGDKMTGRHGNKGVISQVLPSIDMPFLADGTPLDIILNPIGISSRMNLGQVLEVHLGWACSFLGKKISFMLSKANNDYNYIDLKYYLYHLYKSSKERSIISKLTNKEIITLSSKLFRAPLMSTSSFIGASERDLEHFMDLANINSKGQTNIFDGKTGEMYDHSITVGYMYILKLNHLVDEKIHTRFTGPYHRITEQPLGGKSRNGGQRFGEMEVWALQAYGAAYTLVDMVAFKSDLGKKGIHGFPEAFNVLIRELIALGFGINAKK